VQCLAYGPLGGPNAYLPNDLLPHPVVTKVAEETGKTNGQVRLSACLGALGGGAGATAAALRVTRQAARMYSRP